jgi:hypothetical protein
MKINTEVKEDERKRRVKEVGNKQTKNKKR